MRLLGIFFGDMMPQIEKLHTISWKKLAKPKFLVGLGIRTACHQNKIQFLKRIWRFNSDSNSLWARILKGKYGETISKRKTLKSHSLHSMQRIVPIYTSWTRKIIGDGKDTYLWEDTWLSNSLRSSFIGLLKKSELEKTKK